MNNDSGIRPLCIGDLGEIYKMSIARGMYTHMSLEQWREYFHWAVESNPYREGRVMGHVITDNSRLIGAMYYIYVPFAMKDWNGTTPILSGLCVRKDAPGILAIRMHQYFLDTDESNVCLFSHVGELGAKIIQRSGARMVLGSEISLTGILSVSKSVRIFLDKSDSMVTSLLRYLPNIFLKLAGQFKGMHEVKTKTLQFTCHTNIEALSRFSKEIDRLANDEDTDIARICKNTDYIRWRYTCGPFSKQHFIGVVISPQGDLAGWTVIRSLPHSNACVIMELKINQALPHAFSQVFFSAVQLIRDSGGNLVFARLGHVNDLAQWELVNMRAKVKLTPQMWIYDREHLDSKDAFLGCYTHGDHSFY